MDHLLRNYNLVVLSVDRITEDEAGLPCCSNKGWRSLGTKIHRASTFYFEVLESASVSSASDPDQSGLIKALGPAGFL